MRHIFLLLAVLLSAQVNGQYQYDEQRQKELNNYLESIRKGREYGNTKTSEFKMMALLWVRDVKVNNEMQVKMVYDEWSSIILDAYTEYLAKEKTGSFEELMVLVDQFKYAGFTALKSFEKLQTRFPQKKTVIDFFIPFYGSNFWKQFGYQKIGTEVESASAYLLSGDADKTEMNERLRSWLKTSQPLIKELEFIYRNSLTFKSLIDDLQESRYTILPALVSCKAVWSQAPFQKYFLNNACA